MTTATSLFPEIRFPSSASPTPSELVPIMLSAACAQTIIPCRFGSGARPAVSVPIRLPEMRLLLVPVFSSLIPQSVLPEMTFPSLASLRPSPLVPMKLPLDPFAMFTPMRLATAIVPVGSVPMKLPRKWLPMAFASTMLIPSSVLPEMTLRSSESAMELLLVPMILFLVCSNRTPHWFPRAFVPVASTPIQLPATRLLKDSAERYTP